MSRPPDVVFFPPVNVREGKAAMDNSDDLAKRRRAPWRNIWNEIIFSGETPAGRVFDVVLLIVILLSVLTVLLESVPSIQQAYGTPLFIAEWIFTALFTVEYAARLATATNAGRYARSFFGIVDLLAIAPIYLSIFFGFTHSFSVLRSLRLLRVFRILKLTQFVGEASALRVAMLSSVRKITVFLFAVLMIVIIAGALMYQIEGEQNGFTSIPVGMYWAVVTVTTVGYGDISPKTLAGRLLASILMILGYGIIAVPTGIVSYELARGTNRMSNRICRNCAFQHHDADASYCKHCGALLPGQINVVHGSR
jgi:voltage-gated potassium channel